MVPFKPHCTNRVSSTLPEAEISKTAVVELGGKIRAVHMSHPTATLIRLAFVLLFVGLGVFSLPGSHPAYALAAADACSPTTASPGSIGWRSCGDQLDCAWVLVPLDWDNPNGLKIRLSVIRYRASDPTTPSVPCSSTMAVREFPLCDKVGNIWTFCSDDASTSLAGPPRHCRKHARELL
jgi:hypothetical protein